MKTTAIRLDDELHAQLVILAQLDGIGLGEEIRQAIEGHVAAKRNHPDFVAKAKEVLEGIDREANTRRSAIQALLEDEGSKAAPKTTRAGAGGKKA